jgi:hypothetical protein
MCTEALVTIVITRQYDGARDGSVTVRARAATGELGPPSPLDPRCDLRNHSPTGFAWGYNGSGPSQLALALLCDHVRHQPADVELLRRLYGEHSPADPTVDELVLGAQHELKRRLVARLPQGEPWTLTSNQIHGALVELAGAKR